PLDAIERSAVSWLTLAQQSHGCGKASTAALAPPNRFEDTNRRSLCFHSLVTGYPFFLHSRMPPSIEATFVYPIRWRLSAASAERNPPPQYRTTGAFSSGTCCSM